MWSHGAEARLADRPTPRRIPSVASVNMRRGFGLRLNGFRGSRRAFRLSRLRPPRPTVAPKSSSKLTLRWSERDSKSRSRRQRNGRGEGARSNPSVAIGPELDAETGGRSGPPSGTLGDYSRERDRELDRTRAKSGMAARLNPKASMHGLPYATSQHHSCPSRCPPFVPSRGVPDRGDGGDSQSRCRKSDRPAIFLDCSFFRWDFSPFIGEYLVLRKRRSTWD